MSDEPGQFGLAPQPRAASWTNHLMDWVVLASNDVLPDQARLLYWLLKSFILDDKGQEGDRVVQITQEDLADIRGCSVDTIQRALKSLYATGLVEDRERRKVSVRVPGQKKPSVTTLLIMQINEAPPPAGYRGWSRPFDARKEVRARRASHETAGQPDTASARCQNKQAIVDNSSVVAAGQPPPTPANGHVDHQSGVSAGRCDTAPVPENGAPVPENGAPVRPIGSKSFGSNHLEEDKDTAAGQLPLLGAGSPPRASDASPNGSVSATAHLDALFDEFYASYPKKAARKEARRKFETALKDRRVTARELIDGARQYAEAMAGTADRYVKHPSTWLHQGCWADEHPAPEAQPEQSNGYQSYRDPDPAEYHQGWSKRVLSDTE